MEIHICSITEYDNETRVPTIVNPNSSTFYLVPTEDGTSPDLFTEWVYVNNAWEMFGSASIDLSGYLTDVKINGASIVTDGVANVPLAGSSTYGVIKLNTNGSEGIQVNSNTGRTMISAAYASLIKAGNDGLRPIVPTNQHQSTFYGLAKAAGHDEKDSTLSVGQYTDEAKSAIQDMLDVPSKSDIPIVNVDDVQINGTSIVENGVANIPKAGPNKLGTVAIKQYGANGIQFVDGNGHIGVTVANSSVIKQGANTYQTITPNLQHEAVFYGLSKVAGANLINETVTTGEYPDNAKDKIQTMLGVSPLIAPHESDPFESAHVIGELFIINGKLYRAKTALTAGEYINEGINVEVVDVAEVLDSKVDDIQIDGTSIVENGIAEISFATSNAGGVVKIDSSLGIKLNDTNKLLINRATTTQAKAGSDAARPIVPICQHESVFYGLTKAAGVDMASSSNAVGTYTDEAKTAIKQMLGIHDTIDSFVEEVTGTDVTITGQPSYRYNCGELYSLTVTPPSSGTIDIRFTSGSTPTVLTLPSTVKMPEWWVEVEANTIYEMCITDGIYCGVMSWAM